MYGFNTWEEYYHIKGILCDRFQYLGRNIITVKVFCVYGFNTWEEYYHIKGILCDRFQYLGRNIITVKVF